MKHIISSLLLLIALGAAAETDGDGARTVYNDDAKALLGDWFGIDLRYPTEVGQEPMEADTLGRRYRVQFNADDGALVTGTLGMPSETDGPVPLALAMHPMGADERIWWNSDAPVFGGRLVDELRKRGFAVLTLDARLHGLRRVENVGPREMIGFARGNNPTPYVRMIVDTVRDYRIALHWADTHPELDTDRLFVLGYSMGAQMSLLLASVEPRVRSVLTMVPPYVDRALSPVAPRNHVARIDQARVLMLLARNDPYSSPVQNRQVFEALATPHKQMQFFASEHVLPEAYLQPALAFIADSEGVR
jgi:dienelactone hydrolase